MKKYEVHLRTSRAGALAGLGHDLDLIVENIEVTEDADQVRAIAKADSVKVYGALSNAQVDTESPGKKDREKILNNIQTKVLNVKRFPVVTFEASTSQVESGVLEGTLELCGVRRPWSLRRVDGEWAGKVHQPDFGIEPYSTMMGQLRVAEDVVVLITVSEKS